MCPLSRPNIPQERARTQRASKYTLLQQAYPRALHLTQLLGIRYEPDSPFPPHSRHLDLSMSRQCSTALRIFSPVLSCSTCGHNAIPEWAVQSQMHDIQILVFSCPVHLIFESAEVLYVHDKWPHLFEDLSYCSNVCARSPSWCCQICPCMFGQRWILQSAHH